MKRNIFFSLWITCFFIIGFYCISDAKKSIWQCGKELLLRPINCIISHEEAVSNDMHKNTIAMVRKGNELCQCEREYRLLRSSKVKDTLEKKLNISLDNKRIPTISIICSGGGYRALLGTIGSLSGLEKIGILDSVTYISSLSGSTWAVGLWMSTGMTLKQLKHYVSKRLMTNFYRINKLERKRIARMLLIKIAFKQPFSVVDLFGSLVAHHLFASHFNDKSQMIHLSDQSELIQKGTVPFPIYTAIDGRMRAVYGPSWYEFTPCEIGSANYALYIPTWAFGRTFFNGQSTNYAPEQSLGFLFGTFGSAFGAHLGLAWDHVIKDLTSSPVKSLIQKALVKTKIAQLRIFWAKVSNFMRGLEIDDINLKKQKYIKLVDAGIDCNLPYQPVSGERVERKPDILIFFDFSRSRIPHSLKKSEEYARKKGLKFPPIDYTDIENKTISVYQDPHDSSVPVVIYMPRISDSALWESKRNDARYKKYKKIEHFNFAECALSGFCNTLNFQYKQYQSKQVMDQMEFNVLANEDLIIEAIRSVVERINE